MALHNLDGNVRDQNEAVVAGALVYVYDTSGELAALSDALGQPAKNPVTADEDGYFAARVAEEGYYTLKYFWGGRLRYTEANVVAGRSPMQELADDLAATQILRNQAEALYNQTATAIELGNVDPLTTVGVDFVENAGNNYSIGQKLFQAAMTPGVRTGTDGGDNTVDLNLVVSGGRLTNGPVGAANYWNNVWGLGWNIDTVFNPINPDMPAMSYRMESKFNQGGGSTIFGCEFHLPEVLPINDTGGAQATLRPISIFVPHKQSDKWSDQHGITFQAASLNYVGPAHELRMQVRMYDNGSASVAHPVVSGNSVQYLFDRNNAAFNRQKNAAGTDYINADYLDDQDRWRRTGPSYESGPTPAVSVNSEASGHGRFFRESFDSAPVAGGGWQFHLPNVAVAGNFTGLHLQGFSVSGTLYPSRSHNTHATGGVLSRQESSGGKNGIAFVDQSVGNTHWVIGRRASDGGFVIANDPLDLEGTGNPLIWATPYDGTKNSVFIETANLGNYADDAAAAAGGVAVKQLYRNGSQLMVRVA